ncbi:hypothetical protein bpr_I2275 [Butyrivibrio proteoclasticus B316]|uniref:Uncharacterized protein n=1 Tax=Butyrivibrio proteoclasticus (strain ATCC 51982 / DSM 14932 / B316) TaxID=515622 RepID=E0RY53_BUTPB|nr:hypothetical protein [Butyrivibrio proteoclasticus]ADL35008.1 hypothetical protein bpr_I2275 [Butyrivibrio proteoclasticus B316]
MQAIAFLSLLICLWNIGDYPKDERVGKYKWMTLVPFIAVFLIAFSFFEAASTSVPQGKNITKLVKVEDSDDNVLYWNLLINVDTDGSYDVEGFVSPADGRIIEVEPYSYEYFGQEASFTCWDEELDDHIRYDTIIYRQDVDVAIMDRVKSLGIFNVILYSLGMLISIYASYISIKYWQKWNKDN